MAPVAILPKAHHYFPFTISTILAAACLCYAVLLPRPCCCLLSRPPSWPLPACAMQSLLPRPCYCLLSRPPSLPLPACATQSSFSPGPAAAPAASGPAGPLPGLEGLANWIALNFSGMGKSGADVLPELRRRGIAAAGNSFSMNGQIMGAPEIASALRLQVSCIPHVVLVSQPFQQERPGHGHT